MSLCNVLKNMIINDIRSTKTNRFTFKNQVLDFIAKETKIPLKDIGYYSPVELVEDLLINDKIPLYTYKGDIKTLHNETQVLIRLGFCIIEDQYLKLDKGLSILFKELEQIKAYNESLQTYNKIINKYSK